MTVEDFYKICDKLGMVEYNEYDFSLNPVSKIPNNLPELLSFLDEILALNDTSTVKNLLLCMIDLPLGGNENDN